MREGLKLSSTFFLLALLMLLQMLAQFRFDFLTLLFVAVGASLWCEGQASKPVLRILQGILLATGLFCLVCSFVPIPLNGISLGSFSASWLGFDRLVLQNTGLYAFLKEVYQYATIPEKMDFFHWETLALILLLTNAELLYWIHKSKLSGPCFLLGTVAGGLLWFSYLEVWVVFPCFFVAYAIERLTRQGKGALFGFILPLGIVVCALIATNLTPVEAINEKFSPLTSENGWFRTMLNLTPGTGVFGLREAGFYPLEDRLGGPVKLSKEIFFRVRSATPKIYLRGRSMITYKNNKWEAEEVEPEPFTTVLSQQKDQINYFIYDFKSKTNSVMVPMSVSQIDIDPEKLSYGPEETILYKGNVKSELKNGFNVTGYNNSFKQPGSDGRYLQLPASYSPKVVALTQQIIKGAKSDEEKVKRIRKYLLNNYTYALAVAVPPEDQDFVEYFLMEEDTGYCVYFATSTVVMSRIAGLPSRYVEGFVTPERFEAGRDAAVSGERAHAWAEIFYNHKWNIVETTPTFTSLTEYDQQDTQLKSDLIEPEKDKNSSKEEKDLEPQILPEEDEAQSNHQVPIGVVLFIGGMGLLIGIIGLRFRAFFKATPKQLKEKYVQLLLLGLTQHFDLRNSDRLSPRQILYQCDTYAPSLKLRSLVEIVEKSLYDSNDISDAELEQLAQAYWQIFHSYFKWPLKLRWCAKIVGKGRIFNGNDGKSSAT